MLLVLLPPARASRKLLLLLLPGTFGVYWMHDAQISLSSSQKKTNGMERRGFKKLFSPLTRVWEKESCLVMPAGFYPIKSSIACEREREKESLLCWLLLLLLLWLLWLLILRLLGCVCTRINFCQCSTWPSRGQSWSGRLTRLTD